MTYWHRYRDEHLMPRLLLALVALGYDPEELEGLDLQDATILTLRAAEQFNESGIPGPVAAAEHIGLAALALQTADQLRDALPYIANTNIGLALRDFAAARQALGDSIPAGRPAGTNQKELTA